MLPRRTSPLVLVAALGAALLASCTVRQTAVGPEPSRPASTTPAVAVTIVLHDPYTATTVGFRRGAATSTAVQIDHVVSVAV